MVAVAPASLDRAAGGVPSSRRRADRAGHLHRRRRAAGAPRRSAWCSSSTPTFLHDGRPQRTMTAELPDAPAQRRGARRSTDHAATLLALLAHPNIASKEAIIRRYDHEIRGTTVVRPLVGVRLATRRPTASCWPSPTRTSGIAIGIGVNPWYGVARRRAHGPRRGRRGDPQRGRRRRRSRRGRADGQLLVGRPAPPDHAGRSRRRRRRRAARRRPPTARRSSAARTR